MNTQGSETSAEAVRIRAVRLVCDQGWSTEDVAQAVGRSQRSVQLWVQKSRHGKKPEQLRTKKAPGMKPKVVDWAAGGGVDQAGVRRVISCELFARLAAVIGDDGAATEIATVRAEREGHRPLGQSSLASD